MQEAVPARIHVLLARDAPIGVVIRRGPSSHVCTIGWDLTNDTFTVGQWLKGRIYERRSDISPDGRHMIYFAKRAKQKTPATESWTAMSRTPYLKAIGLWTKSDSWNGGGLFADEQAFWLNDGYGHELVQEPVDLSRIQACPVPGDFGDECPGIYYPRLQRDGWRLVASETIARHHHLTSFRKSVGVGWSLQKLAFSKVGENKPGKGVYYDEHAIVDESNAQVIRKADWEWADFDRKRNRLVWSESGKLFAGKMSDSGIEGIRELYDFNPMKFEPIAAPY